MKYFRVFILSLMVSLLSGFTFGYQQYGFSEYNEKAGNISFSCTNQCYITLGEKNNIDYLNIQGSVNGNGDIAYGFTMGEQIAVINQLKVFLQTQVNESIKFSDYAQYFSTVPGNANLILLINGNIKGDINVDANVFSIGEKLSKGWKDFRTFDSFKPYTINLSYGPIVNGKNFNKGFYVIFLVILVVVLLMKKDKKTKIKILLSGLLILWCIYDIRMGLEGIKYYNDDFKSYISQNKYEKAYRDRGDFYSFVDFVQDTLKTQGVKDYQEIGFFTDNTRPFPGSMKYFLYPYRIRDNQNTGKYIIVYQSSKVKIINNNNIEIDGNVITGSIIKFQDYAFIFIKNK